MGAPLHRDVIMFLWMLFWEGPICLAGYESMFGVSECKTPLMCGGIRLECGAIKILKGTQLYTYYIYIHIYIYAGVSISIYA